MTKLRTVAAFAARLSVCTAIACCAFHARAGDPTPPAGQGPGSKKPASRPLNLNGDWQSSEGCEIHIDHTPAPAGGSFDSVLKNPGNRTYYISGTLQGNHPGATLSGKMQRETDPSLIRDCGLKNLWETNFSGTVPDEATIILTYTGQVWKQRDKQDQGGGSQRGADSGAGSSAGEGNGKCDCTENPTHTVTLHRDTWPGGRPVIRSKPAGWRWTPAAPPRRTM